MMEHIRVAGIWIAQKEIDYVSDAVIICGPFFIPLSSEPAYCILASAIEARWGGEKELRTEFLINGVNLPCRMNIDHKKDGVVCNTIKEVVGGG
jgi:hypothetical protein